MYCLKVHIQIKISQNTCTLKDDLHSSCKICILNYRNLSYSSTANTFKNKKKEVKRKNRTQWTINIVSSTVFLKDYKTNLWSFLFWMPRHIQYAQTALVSVCGNCSYALEWIWSHWMMCVINVNTQGILQNQLQGKRWSTTQCWWGPY